MRSVLRVLTRPAGRSGQPGRAARPARLPAVIGAVGLFGASVAGVMPTAHASLRPADSGTAYGGFSTDATATPLRIEVHEPAIPIPADPELEFNFSYSTVAGQSGPTSTARSSAMWPGDPIGEGLKTIITAAGLPAQLAANGYPVQVNAQSPGTPSTASQEFLPGMVGDVSASSTGAVARSGYSSSGNVTGDPSSGVLGGLANGDLSSFGSALDGGTGSTASTRHASPAPTDSPTTPSSPAGSAASTNPLGALSILVSAQGMSSSSRTDYSSTDTVTSRASSQVGEIDLIGGIVKLEGVTVTTNTSSSLDGGGKATHDVTYGGITIAGTPFKITSDGLVAATSKTAIPDLPDTPAKALATLGLSIDLPKPTSTTSGASASAAAFGPEITLDAAPLTKMLKLDKLPIAGLINQLPDSAGQAKSLLLAALQAHPKIVIYAGHVSSDAQTIAAIPGGTVPPPGSTTPGSSTGATGGTGGTGGLGSTPGTGGVPTASGTVPTTSAPITNTSAVPGLPPLGSIPGLLTVGGIALAAGTGWWLRRGAAALLGGGATCPHGLLSGLPDLRKVR